MIDQIHGEHKYYLHLKVRSVIKKKKKKKERRARPGTNILTKESKPERIKASHRPNPNYTYLQLHISDQGFPRVSIKEGDALPFTKSPLMLAKISSSKKKKNTFYPLLSVHLLAN